MDAILNYRSEDTEDYYTLLGCDELSSMEFHSCCPVWSAMV
ncbi:DNAJC12 isoform 5 [Pongo abelii]|uniref:DNAJC12 isoform 5 n=1 Tax=Pongo abelii TaxID=9601 RepID=A0A2J8WR48_PONAB|nr:DNAJC12 isoform 5 [Pongo abelii]